MFYCSIYKYRNIKKWRNIYFIFPFLLMYLIQTHSHSTNIPFTNNSLNIQQILPTKPFPDSGCVIWDATCFQYNRHSLLVRGFLLWHRLFLMKVHILWMSFLYSNGPWHANFNHIILIPVRVILHRYRVEYIKWKWYLIFTISTILTNVCQELLGTYVLLLQCY